MVYPVHLFTVAANHPFDNQTVINKKRFLNIESHLGGHWGSFYEVSLY